MSRAYQMTIHIQGWNHPLRHDIMQAAEEAGNFDFTKYTPTEAWGHVTTSLHSGETEKQFCQRVAKVVWVANRGFCQVNITCCCLEDPPLYCMGPDQYHEVEDEVKERIAEEIDIA